MNNSNYRNIISLAKFLRICYDVKHKDIGRITHEDIKEMIPELESVSFAYYNDNSYDVARGNIVLVRDGKGKLLPYRMPVVIHDLGSFCVPTKEEETETLDDVLKNIDIPNLTNNELVQLYTQYRYERGSHRLRREMQLRGMHDKSSSRKEVKTLRKKISVLSALGDYE